MGAQLCANNVAVGWSGVTRPTLVGFNLTACAGDIIGLCGPNGSGKSSLLGALSGLDEPNLLAGRVLWWSGHGAEPWSKEFAQGQTLLLRQVAPFVPTDRVRSFFDLFRDAPSFSDDRLRDLSLRFGVDSLLDTPLSKLSGGQWRRVQCAAHFATSCAVRLLDEPETGLDGSSFRELAEQIRAASARGEIILLATHSAVLVRAVAHQVCCFESGSCVWQSNTELFERFGPRIGYELR